MRYIYPVPRQKKRLRFLVLTLALFLLMGCAASRASSTPESGASSTPEKQEVQTSDIASTRTATTAIPLVATMNVSGTATPRVVSTVSREAQQATSQIALTPKALHTPKARSEWRAMGGELFVRFKGGIKIFEYYLTVPPNWGGIFEMQQEEEDAILFFYTGHPDLKVEVFRLTALREESWQQKKSAGDRGNQVSSQRGAVFVLNVAQENPFDSEEPEAETFQTMRQDVPELIAETLEIVSRRE